MNEKDKDKTIAQETEQYIEERIKNLYIGDSYNLGELNAYKNVKRKIEELKNKHENTNIN